MGTPPQIIERRVLPPSHAEFDELDDAASASPDSHPVLNGAIQSVVIAPQSSVGWPNDPTGIEAVSSMIKKWMAENKMDIPTNQPDSDAKFSRKILFSQDLSQEILTVPINSQRFRRS
jgi:hypothetical protein